MNFATIKKTCPRGRAQLKRIKRKQTCRYFICANFNISVKIFFLPTQGAGTQGLHALSKGHGNKQIGFTVSRAQKVEENSYFVFH